MWLCINIKPTPSQCWLGGGGGGGRSGRSKNTTQITGNSCAVHLKKVYPSQWGCKIWSKWPDTFQIDLTPHQSTAKVRQSAYHPSTKITQSTISNFNIYIENTVILGILSDATVLNRCLNHPMSRSNFRFYTCLLKTVLSINLLSGYRCVLNQNLDQKTYSHKILVESLLW